MNKTKFLALVKELVPNYKEFKGRWEFKRGGYVRFYFSHRGRICYLGMCKDLWSLEQWSGHLINFYNTGKMDTHAYWEPYLSSGKDGDFGRDFSGEIYKTKMDIKSSGEFYTHSEQAMTFINKYRKK